MGFRNQITDLRGLDVEVATLTGGLRTAASGKRIELGIGPQSIRYFTGDALEISPARIDVNTYPDGGGLPEIVLSPPDFTGTPYVALLRMRNRSVDGTFTAEVNLAGDAIYLLPSPGGFVDVPSEELRANGSPVQTAATAETWYEELAANDVAPAAYGGLISWAVPGATWARKGIVHAVLDSSITAGGTGHHLASLLVDGVLQPGSAIQVAAAVTRETVAQLWRVDLTAGVPHTIELQHRVTGTGTASAGGQHTKLAAQLVRA